MKSTFQYPTPEQVRWHMQEARRMRSETVHERLKSAGAWLADGPPLPDASEPQHHRRSVSSLT
jgi:hypothetical protein